jgi:hypothetical protein
VAREHTSSERSYWIEFTRDLNGEAEEYANEESCWWTSHSYSRCALKQWGGLALRSYRDLDAESYSPAGRAWVQPLNAKKRPTHDVMNAHAYLVYNGYGVLAGYQPARIVAQLAGLTYRKVGLVLSPQYVNGATGYLVADEVTCKNTEHVELSADVHDTHDHNHLEEVA